MMTGLLPGLDWDTCDRARLARDRAFDGAFFTGVRTTRIYCRPVCPVRPARSANVVFFGSAAAAERAGFRPCLRCRPETAPGSPAWNGSDDSRAWYATDRGRIPGRSLNRGIGRTPGRRVTPPVTAVSPSYRREPNRYCCDAARAGGEAVDRSNDIAAVRHCFCCRVSQRAALQRCVPGHLWPSANVLPQNRVTSRLKLKPLQHPCDQSQAVERSPSRTSLTWATRQPSVFRDRDTPRPHLFRCRKLLTRCGIEQGGLA